MESRDDQRDKRRVRARDPTALPSLALPSRLLRDQAPVTAGWLLWLRSLPAPGSRLLANGPRPRGRPGLARPLSGCDRAVPSSSAAMARPGPSPAA